jgi:hypothetical protein
LKNQITLTLPVTASCADQRRGGNIENEKVRLLGKWRRVEFGMEGLRQPCLGILE